jgi:hypothetical protein
MGNAHRNITSKNMVKSKSQNLRISFAGDRVASHLKNQIIGLIFPYKTYELPTKKTV